MKGRRTADVLAESLPGIILGINWPKAMYWNGKGSSRFIRPIRWLIALLGDTVIPFEIEGVRSGNMTQGHRILGKKNVEVTFADYEPKLRENYVELSADNPLRPHCRVRSGGRREARSGTRANAHVHDGMADADCRIVRRGVPAIAARNSGDGDASPPAIFRVRDRGRRSGASIRRRHEYGRATRRG